jgi:excisionase family DNA binding protein
MTYAKWLKAQLRRVEELANHPEPDLSDFDDLRSLIREAARRAAAAGVPDAVRACKIRRGPISTSIAREVLAACLAAVPVTQTERLTPPQAAKRLGISPDTVLGFIRRGELKASNVSKAQRPRYRITPEALAEFEARRTTERPQVQRRRKPSTSGLIITRFSSDQ